MNPIYKFCINRATVNLLDPTMIRQGLLNTNTGILDKSNNIYSSSDYISITSGTDYKLRRKSDFVAYTPAAVCFYTANKTFISGQYGWSVIPANATYFRVSMQGLNNYGIFASTVASWSDFVSPRVYPIYKADLAKEYNKEQNEQFYRATLEGKLTFQRDDYAWILAQAFDFEYIITLYISYDAGYSWDEYWTGNFWKTDCDFDEDAQTVIVQPTVKDQYTKVLAGIEKEFNLIDLAPEMTMIKADKRPMIQVYIPGDSTVGCLLAGMSWEQECDVVTDEDALVNTYKFALSASLAVAEVTSSSYSPEIPTIFTKRFAASKFNPSEQGTTELTASEYKLVYSFGAGTSGSQYSWTIVRISDNVSMWRLVVRNQAPPLLPVQITLTPVSGSSASGNITLYVHNISVYCRYVLDVDTIMYRNTSPIPDDDIVENNRNYRRVIDYKFPSCVFFSTNLTTTPTKWGMYQPGEYYQKPAMEYYYGEFFPISRREWGRVSVWFAFYAFDQQIEEEGRKSYVIKNNYPLWSAISVLLGQIAPEITHEATTEYSEFLYSSVDPVAYCAQKLFLTPKSNILTANYDQPAQKAPVTLRKILDMLRDCFRLYWFIDDQNRFRIEHITWFMKGGSYSILPDFGADLRLQIVTRNGKPWAFARNQYKFDKPAMAERYEFGWMDEVTYLFEGFPIDITSKYVTPGNIQQTKIDQFTSDIDYMLLNPSACSKDGFALLGAVQANYITPDASPVSFGAGSYRDISVTGWKVGETISIVCNLLSQPANRPVVLSFYNANNVLISTIAQVLAGNDDEYNISAVVPEGATKIRFTTNNVAGSVGVMMKAVYGEFTVPYGSIRTEYSNHELQNFFCSFVFLENNYYVFDMPAPHYRINGADMTALGIKKLKTQGIRFPLLHDIDLNKLIKTTLGDGVIDKLSINLSSRNANATLKYDTE